MVRRLYVFALLAPLSAGSCAARGPNYTRPTVTPPAAFRGATVTATQAASIADLPWFEMFKEPEPESVPLGCEGDAPNCVPSSKVKRSRPESELSPSRP